MSAKAFAVIMKPLIDLYGEPRNWAANRDVYFEALRDVPERLLDTAVKHWIRTSVFFPKPAELRGTIAHEMNEHRWRLQRAFDDARALPPPVETPVSEEEKAAVDAVMNEWRKAVAGRTDFLKGKAHP